MCFIAEVLSRVIVGWRAASHMRTTTVLDALEMARKSRRTVPPGLRWHCDWRATFHRHHRPLAETVNGYCKSEVIFSLWRNPMNRTSIKTHQNQGNSTNPMRCRGCRR
ncbi:hypothetical protein A4G28_09700 [Mycobacterium ostraviense]|uniref:Transposase n=1 Tax=Mycobacterium ostraviense TaxID=2738409 RepID=A0A163XPE9_9MYCO|nr:hypothetical protein A4G28_09700 [Mycobacterium ostraviense]